MDAYYGLISAKLNKLLECGRRTNVEPEGIIEPLDAIVDGIAARVKDIIASERSGDFYVTGGAACFVTAQSRHRYS